MNSEANVCDAFANKGHTLSVSLDLEKSYDMVWRDQIIVNILTDIQVNGLMLRCTATIEAYSVELRAVHIKSH